MYQLQDNIEKIHPKKTPLKLSDIAWIDVYNSEEKKVVKHHRQEILTEGAQ